MTETQGSQLSEPAQCLEATIGDLGLLQKEPLEAREFSQELKALVRYLRVVQPQLAEMRQDGKMPQTVIVHFRTREVKRFELVKVEQPAQARPFHLRTVEPQ